MLKSKQLVHAIIWFAIFLIIIAIFFGLLRAPFLALGQLIIFTGGMIAILLIGISFSGMESTGYSNPKVPGTLENRWYKIVALFFLLTLMVSIKLFFAKNTVELPAKALALQLFGAYWPVLAIVMLMFIAAFLSAVYFLKKDE